MKENSIHSLIAKFLSEEAENEEIKYLQEWRNLSSGNEQQFQQYKEVWELAHTPSISHIIPDKELVWDRIRSKIEESAPIMYSRSFLFRSIGIAVTITLLIGFSLSFLFPSEKTVEKSEVTVKTLRGQKTEIALPDGSVVWLNGESSLTYATDFLSNNREVKLTGEAFFDVTHASEAFKVNTENIQVQVHGTAFNVNTYQGNDIQVSLLRGHVTVHTLESDRLLADLFPGYKACISNHTQETIITACDTEVEGLWRHGILKVVDEPMVRLIEKMERWYGVDIILEDKARDEHYWLTIKTESLTETLTLINKITPISYQINGEEVIIKYK